MTTADNASPPPGGRDGAPAQTANGGRDGAPATPSSGGRDESSAGATPEVCQTVTICNRRGLHARAAAKFVKLAGRFDCEIEVRRGDTLVSGISIMGLMMLAAGTGTTVELCAYGDEAEAAVAALAELIERKFDED